MELCGHGTRLVMAMMAIVLETRPLVCQ